MSSGPFEFAPAHDPAPRWVDLYALDELQVNVGIQVRLEQLWLAVFKLPDGTVCVVDDQCPHAGASLHRGHVDEDGCVICPRHAWHFDLKTGRMPDSSIEHLPTYAVRLENGRVLADISRPRPVPPVDPARISEP
jgi:nitrite reductase (NADH) small subunit